MNDWWTFGEHSGQFGSGFDSAYLNCPFCDTRGNFTQEYSQTKTSGDDRKKLNYETLKCGNCANLTMVFWSANSSNSYGAAARNIYSYRTLPFPLGKYEGSENWPEPVRRHWVQAKDNLSRNNLEAAAVMARSTLQGAIRGRLEPVEGETPTNQKTFIDLFGDINRLHEEGTIPNVLKDWAHEVRLFARTAAHPNGSEEDISKDDLNDVMQFIDFLLEYLYDVPARIEIYRSRQSSGNEDDGN